MPHAGHLTQVLAQHEFQEAFKNYRDLRFLAKNLERLAGQAGRASTTCWPSAARPSPTGCRWCRRASRHAEHRRAASQARDDVAAELGRGETGGRRRRVRRCTRARPARPPRAVRRRSRPRRSDPIPKLDCAAERVRRVAGRARLAAVADADRPRLWDAKKELQRSTTGLGRGAARATPRWPRRSATSRRASRRLPSASPRSTRARAC